MPEDAPTIQRAVDRAKTGEAPARHGVEPVLAARFGRGFGWLSGELRKESFELGVWVGALCVADTHPIVREHPEWLLRGDDSGDCDLSATPALTLPTRPAMASAGSASNP